MNRRKTVFNATMALVIRAAGAALVFIFWELPYGKALLEPGAALAADTIDAGLALLVVAFFGGLVLSGLYVFIRMLTGANVIADPAHWREQVMVRRGIRLVLFLVVLLFWVPEFLSVGEWIDHVRAGGRLAVDDTIGVIWTAAAAWCVAGFLLAVWGPVPVHVKAVAAGDGFWSDFLEDFLPGGDAYGPAGEAT